MFSRPSLLVEYSIMWHSITSMKNRVITFAALFVFAFATVFNWTPGFASGELSGPALEQLTGISGAQAGETAVLPVPVKAIPPGRDLLPQFSDPGRVKVILKVIEDIYYERPFPYQQDGTVFHNWEKLLPRKPDGHYREYTVIPPENSPSNITVGGQNYYIPSANGHRGVERLVIGGGETVYYTPDHYKTFIQLVVIRWKTRGILHSGEYPPHFRGYSIFQSA